MTKICGFFSATPGKYNHAGQIRLMTQSMKREDQHQVDHFSNETIGLGHISIGVWNGSSQPVWDEEKKMCIVFSGVIYGREKLIPREDRKRFQYRREACDAEFILAAYKHSGTKIFSGLNGIFTLAIWDSEGKKLLVCNDRYGFRPLYYYRDEGKFIFASEVEAVIQDSTIERKINWKAWSDLFNLGWVAGNDTYFEGIHAFPPATIMEISPDNYRCSSYWTYQDIKENKAFNEDDAVTIASGLLRNAISMMLEKAAGKQIIVPLSGGYDSRMIAACLKEMGAEFKSYTTRRDSDVITDVILAEKLKDALDIPWEYIDINRELYPRFFLKCLRDSEYMAPEHLWFNFMIEKLPSPVVIFDGFAGGNSIGFIRHYTPEEEKVLCDPGNKDFSWFINGLPKTSAGETIQNIFREKYSSILRESCSAGLKESFGRFPPESIYLPLFHISNRSRRAITPYMFNMLTARGEALCPFMENGFFDFIMSIPTASRINCHFYERFRREMFPTIADIPTVKSMAPEKIVSREVYCSHRNSDIINNYLMKLFMAYPPPSEYTDHRKAMDYLFYFTRKGGRPDHYKRLTFLRSYLVFVIWYNNYFETNRFSRMKNELKALSALPLIRIKHLAGR